MISKAFCLLALLTGLYARVIGEDFVQGVQKAGSKEIFYHSVQSILNANKQNIACFSSQDCHVCMLSKMYEDPTCGLEQAWCGCNYSEPLHNEHVMDRKLPLDQTPLDIVKQAQLVLLSNFHVDVTKAIVEEMGMSKLIDDPLSCFSPETCYACFMQQVSNDESCGQEDSFCGCFKTDPGTEVDIEANVAFMENVIHEYNAQGTTQDLNSFDPVDCCSPQDCYECFRQRVDEDFWCGLSDAWCNCKLVDCLSN